MADNCSFLISNYKVYHIPSKEGIALKIGGKLLERKTGGRSRYWQVFWLCFAVAAALFLPHCIIDGLNGDFFHYAGDFNDQQISFYSYANNFVKQGGSFSWATDLGSGFVNSYSFYLCGSPFFWLTLLLPYRWTPWAMVPMLCFKFAVAGGGAYLWMRRWVKDERWSMVGACLYAFSGFTVYNVFFNHFLDVVALFPYMLKALDDAVLDRRRGAFPFWVAVNLLNNYFFFAGQAVFLMIYFVCMVAGGRYKLNLRLFGALAFQTVLGCCMGCALLVPAALSLVQNPRTIDPFNGYGYLVYGSAQQYLAIFYSAFLMPDAPYLKDLFQEGILKHTSMTVYLPVVGIAGGLAFCRARERHPFTYVLKVCVACAFVPVLNSAFYALNSSYYARWYYMPILVLCGATCYLLSRPALAEQRLPRALRLTTFLTLTAVVFAVVPGKDDDGNYTFDIYTCHDQTKVTTNGSISADYTKQEDLTLTFPEGTANAWQYIEDTAISNDPAVLWPAAVSTRAGSGTGVKAGFYVVPAASGVRAAWRCCNLNNGGNASLAAANSNNWVGNANWNGGAGVQLVHQKSSIIASCIPRLCAKIS